MTWDSQLAAASARLSPVLREAGGGDVVAGLPQPASISCNYAPDFCSGPERSNQGLLKLSKTHVFSRWSFSCKNGPQLATTEGVGSLKQFFFEISFYIAGSPNKWIHLLAFHSGFIASAGPLLPGVALGVRIWRVAAPSTGWTGLGSVWSQAGRLGNDFSVQVRFHF